MARSEHTGTLEALAALVGPHLQTGTLQRSVLEQALAAIGADQAVRTDAMQALRDASIQVLEDGPSPLPVPVPVRPVASAARPAPPSDPVQAGRRRIAADRFVAPSRRHRILLTAEEEVGLTLLARPGGAALASGGLAHLEGEAREAADAMVLHNLRLAHSVARTYTGHGLEHDDAYQSALGGLIRAVELFDPGAGYKFSTYATHWLRQAVSRAIANEARAIRIPVHMWEVVRKVGAARERLTVDGVPPSAFQLASELHLDVVKVREAMRLLPAVLSLDTPLGDDQFTLGDLVAARSDAPEHVEVNGLYLDDVEPLLLELREREAGVLRMRFGMAPYDEPHTLDEIGQVYGVTRERIRQIETKAMKNLRETLRRRGWSVPEPDKAKAGDAASAAIEHGALAQSA